MAVWARGAVVWAIVTACASETSPFDVQRPSEDASETPAVDAPSIAVGGGVPQPGAPATSVLPPPPLFPPPLLPPPVPVPTDAGDASADVLDASPADAASTEGGDVSVDGSGGEGGGRDASPDVAAISCTSIADCDDGNVCTTDACDPIDGCIHTPNTLPCSDGNPCTGYDYCYAGTCLGGPTPCISDGNPCTLDFCDSVAACMHVPVADGTPCTVDGNACTQDFCVAGRCNAPVPASDQIVCRAANCTGPPGSAVATLPELCDGTAMCPGPNAVSCGSEPCDVAGTSCQSP